VFFYNSVIRFISLVYLYSLLVLSCVVAWVLRDEEKEYWSLQLQDEEIEGMRSFFLKKIRFSDLFHW
jgi:hypothetical protein